MKFFRKHRKAVSPVIATMLLVAVAVAAVGAYFIWFRSFQTQSQKSVQETSEGALGGGLQVVSMTDDGKHYFINIKNTMSSGTVTLSQKFNVNPGGTVTLVDASTFGIPADYIIAPGTTKTFGLNASWGDLATGQSRTFIVTNTDATMVTTVTYADS